MRCTNCGWDNADQNTRCEKCNAPLENSNGNDFSSTIRETIRETIVEDQPIISKTVNEPIVERVDPKPAEEPRRQTGSSPAYGGTVNPWGGMPFGVPMISYCKLSPLPSAPNEKHLPRELELKGEYNELNRENLEPDNFTISQKVQAVLTCKDGKWFIKDQSPYKTTYVLATEEVPLKDGDVILMGNRRFVFSEE